MLCTPERGGSIDLEPFKVTYVPLAHSIPEGNGLLIETPHGKIFHTGDWKIDETPVLGFPSSGETLAAIGDQGVLALVCDSTNVFQDNASGSEAGVHEGLRSEVARAKRTLRSGRSSAVSTNRRVFLRVPGCMSGEWRTWSS